MMFNMEYEQVVISSVGVLSTLVGVGLLLRVREVRRNCTEKTTGRICRVKAKRWGRSSRFYPVVEYIADGKDYVKESGLSTGLKNKYKVGEPLDVKYNPEKPEEFIVTAAADIGCGIVSLLFGLGVLSIVAYIILFG